MGQKAAPTNRTPYQQQQQQLPPVPQYQPYQKQLPEMPQSVQPKRAPTFTELVHTVKNKRTNAWNNSTKLLQTVFINDLVKDARAAELTQDQLGILLIIARDSHAQFTGNNEQDAQILTNINNQIDNAVVSL
jgi:hypothetical protein